MYYYWCDPAHHKASILPLPGLFVGISSSSMIQDVSFCNWSFSHLCKIFLITFASDSFSSISTDWCVSYSSLRSLGMMLMMKVLFVLRPALRTNFVEYSPVSNTIELNYRCVYHISTKPSTWWYSRSSLKPRTGVAISLRGSESSL